MNRYFLSLCTALLLSNCGGGGGGNDDENGDGGQFSGSCALRVTNGEQCLTGSGPIVLVELLDASQTPIEICSGAFISTRHILTAAHCFDDAASARIHYSDKTIASSLVAIPPGYRSVEGELSSVDFAVVTLAEEAAGAQTLPILVSEPLKNGKLFNIIGYGQDENGNAALIGNDFENSLKKGTMIVNDIDSSLAVFYAEYNDTNQSVCSGDSGSPAIVLNRDGLAGIVGVAQAGADPHSPSAPQCLEDSSAAFTDIQRQGNLDFIRGAVPGVGVI